MSWRSECAVLLILSLAQLARAAELTDSIGLPGRDSARLLSGVPGDLELQRRRARIGRVIVQVDEVFEKSPSLATPYRLVNGLHVSTQQETVLQQLLFRSGDVYDPRLIAESERLLRSQRYLNDALIQPVDYRDNEVDVLVRVHDVWSMSPGISFGRSGGENRAKFSFEDTNFLGRGKQAAIARASDVDRTAWSLAYTDPNVLGSWWRLSGLYATATDGSEKGFLFEHPFYALDTRWSAGLSVADTQSVLPHYSLGEVVQRVDMSERTLRLEGGISRGFQDGWVRRYLAGLRSIERGFSLLADEPGALLPEDRNLTYPWIGIEIIEDDYVRTRNLDLIGRTEDLYLGSSARFELGFASSAFGSTRDALVIGGRLQAGADPGGEQYWINALELGGRVEEGSLANGKLALSTRYYRRHSLQRVSFGSVDLVMTSNPDSGEQLLLGGDNGLRGFPLRYQAGTASALLTFEERFYTNWQPLKLFNVGAAFFLDAGRTWGETELADPPGGWLADVGVGLRLGSARSGLGNVLHIDLAVPLNGPKDIDSVQLLIGTHKSF